MELDEWIIHVCLLFVESTGRLLTKETEGEQLALDLVQRWVKNNYVAYQQSKGKMFEKYDAETVRTLFWTDPGHLLLIEHNSYLSHVIRIEQTSLLASHTWQWWFFIDVRYTALMEARSSFNLFCFDFGYSNQLFAPGSHFTSYFSEFTDTKQF